NQSGSAARGASSSSGVVGRPRHHAARVGKGSTMYYLAQDVGNSCYVFTSEDPRKDGFAGQVQEGIRLDVPDDLHHTPHGQTASAPCLAVSDLDPKHYRVFQYRNECRRAGFQALSLLYVVCRRWSDYKATLNPP